MKLASNDVECDGCGRPMPLQLTDSRYLYVAVRGQSVGHLKGDFCGWGCLAAWAELSDLRRTVV